MAELSGIMDELLPMLRERIDCSKSTFELWFEEFELIELNEDKAVFSTPSNLNKKVLTTRYKKYIDEAMKEIVGFSIQVDVLSTMDLARPPDLDESMYEPIPLAPAYRPDEDELIDLAVKREEESEQNVTALINGTLDKKSCLTEYTFENFVEGSSNKLAKAACYAVAREPNTYNPLFIYGHSGLGKTHLLHAIINYMRVNHPTLKIVYKKCENFLEELVEAIRFGTTSTFKEKYRTADVLLIDDIQFLAGKEQTQEEFFHTFSALYEADKQIILTSDRPPKDIRPLEDRLRSRFEGGLLADVQPPSYELRVAIIRKKADSMGLTISAEMVEYMAERLHENVRQIEGVLKRLYAVQSLTSAEITKSKVDEIISIIDPGNIPTEAMIERILSIVSLNYGESIDNLKSKKKTGNIANARHVAIYLIRKLTELTLKEIGGIFGRDHATIMSSIEKVETNIKTVNNYEADIERLTKEIKQTVVIF